MKRIISIITLIVAVCSGAWAQTDRIAFGTISNGTVTPDNANPPAGAATVTLTVTPATGYYITVSDITVTRTALGAQGRTRTPDLDGTTYPVTAVSVDAIGKGTYSFNVENGYGAYVEAAFTACTAITPVVNITGWTYGAAANAPSVTGNPGNGTVTYDYKVKGAADGTYQATAYIKDKGNHKTSQSTTFTIDNTAPVIVLTRPSTSAEAASSDTYGQTFNLEGQAADNNNVSLIEVQVYKDKECTEAEYEYTIRLKNVPNSNKMYVEKQLNELERNFMAYLSYWNEKYYRNGFVDGARLIIGCL